MHWGDSFILHMLSVARGVICSHTVRTRDISVRVRVGGVEGDSPICFSDFCQAADMAVPLGSSPWESPSWKGGHFCLGACGPQPDLPPPRPRGTSQEPTGPDLGMCPPDFSPVLSPAIAEAQARRCALPARRGWHSAVSPKRPAPASTPAVNIPPSRRGNGPGPAPRPCSRA